MLFQLIFLTEEAEREGEATTPVNSSTQFFFFRLLFLLLRSTRRSKMRRLKRQKVSTPVGMMLKFRCKCRCSLVCVYVFFFLYHVYGVFSTRMVSFTPTPNLLQSSIPTVQAFFFFSPLLFLCRSSCFFFATL